jgi:hypothetical protein
VRAFTSAKSCVRHGSAYFDTDSDSLEQQTSSLEVSHSTTDRCAHEYYLYRNYVLEFDTSIGHLVIEEGAILICWRLEYVLDRGN